MRPLIIINLGLIVLNKQSSTCIGMYILARGMIDIFDTILDVSFFSSYPQMQILSLRLKRFWNGDSVYA